jgi:ABC-type glycerol-3-phosphate transport system permease component
MESMDLFPVSKRQRAVMLAFLLVLALLWVLPIYSLISNSLKGAGLSNFAHVLTNKINEMPFFMYFVNSLIVAACSCVLTVGIASLAGFAFSKIQFVGKNLIFNIVVICLAVSGAIVLVPFFFILKTMHLYNTYFAVILPEVTLTLPFAVLMMRNNFDGILSELMESAYMDGARLWTIFARIFFPLAGPALINLGVLQVMWSFQDFLLPLMFLTKNRLFTSTIAINVFKGEYGVVGPNIGYLNAALVLISVPSILIFSFARRFIVGGLTAGSLKE